MKKIVVIIFIILLISVVACKPKTTKKIEPPKIETTGDAAVDAVGKDLNNVDSIEEDLNIDELNDLDSGLEDIQNI